MLTLAKQLSTYLCRRNPGNEHARKFSYGRDELSIEEEAERNEINLLHQSVSLLRVKDPLFKRMEASRLSRFAIDDERRMKIVEMGGAQELLNMLGAAEDDRTRKEALKAFVALSHSDEAVGALHQAGAVSVNKSIPDSLEDTEVMSCKSSLLIKFQALKYDAES